MAVNFKIIGPEFARRRLKHPDLAILEPDGHLYDILAIQPTGKITVRSGFIGQEDREGTKRRFEHFLEMAYSENCDLALAPEYSCPWETLLNFIVSAKLPQSGKLWIVGCEGIAPDKLKEIISKSRNIEWIPEQLPTGTGSVLGVLAYITHTETVSGIPKHAIVLQFKTQAMGGSPLERNLLIPGTDIYIWQNSQEYIRLLSIICADSLNFNQSQYQRCRCDVDPTLIFHPQLTEDPLHVAMSAYRNNLYLQGSTERLEVISLNWARGFVIPGKEPNPYGGSAIYTKSPQMNISDDLVNANHELGLYFTSWENHRTKLCYFNFNEHLFHFRMPKVAQRGPGVLSQRTGPEMLKLFNWNSIYNQWIPLSLASDGFADLCNKYNNGSGDYCLGNAFNHMDRERLFALSAGCFNPSVNWHQVNELKSFVSESDERCKRLTFTHEITSASNTFREMHISRYSKLQTAIISNANYFPENIHDLKNNCELKPPIKIENYRFNLRCISGTAAPSTGIFVGLKPFCEARQLFEDIVREWGQDKTRRLVVWYERSDGVIEHIESCLPSISDTSEPPGSIIKGGDA